MQKVWRPLLHKLLLRVAYRLSALMKYKKCLLLFSNLKHCVGTGMVRSSYHHTLMEAMYSGPSRMEMILKKKIHHTVCQFLYWPEIMCPTGWEYAWNLIYWLDPKWSNSQNEVLADFDFWKVFKNLIIGGIRLSKYSIPKIAEFKFRRQFSSSIAFGTRADQFVDRC